MNPSIFRLMCIYPIYTKIKVYITDENYNKTGKIVDGKIPFVPKRYRKSIKRAMNNGINGKELLRLCEYIDRYISTSKKLTKEYNDAVMYKRYRLEWYLTPNDLELQFVII